MKSPEQFNPSDEKYKKVEDLPKEEQRGFVDVEGGFIRERVAFLKRFEMEQAIANELPKLLRDQFVQWQKEKRPGKKVETDPKKIDFQIQRKIHEFREAGKAAEPIGKYELEILQPGILDEGIRQELKRRAEEYAVSIDQHEAENINRMRDELGEALKTNDRYEIIKALKLSGRILRQESEAVKYACIMKEVNGDEELARKIMSGWNFDEKEKETFYQAEKHYIEGLSNGQLYVELRYFRENLRYEQGGFFRTLSLNMPDLAEKLANKFGRTKDTWME